ncbi:MAG: hypothetical protein O2854_01105 [Chloroflexi bacterium]|nr:hypothetical protein [Chloroflexota bacterium]
MVKANEIGYPMHPNPVNGLARCCNLAELLNLGQSIARHGVAGHAQADRGDSSCGTRFDIAMAEGAVEAKFLNVPGMRKRDGLIRAFVVAEYTQRLAQPGRDNEHEDADDDGDKEEANETQNAPFD